MDFPFAKKDGAQPAAAEDDSAYIDTAALRIGMHVQLDLSWLEHPFPTSSFKIRTAEQLETLRGLKLKKVRWSPALSDPIDAATPSATEAIEATDTTPAPIVARGPVPDAGEAQRRTIAQCQKALGEAARKVRQMSKTLHAQPEKTREEGALLVQQIADEMLGEADLTIRLMADKIGNESVYHHALNVTLLSLMLARALKAPRPVIELIGLGALFHDIGKFELPDRITRATAPLTRAEASLLETHTAHGVTLGKKMGLSPEALHIIGQHHELVDGSGYPRKLKGPDISLPARIVAVVNAYDNLCNALDPQATMTPHEALALLFGRRRAQFDERVLSTFVRCMGIYPPGTVVALSNERLGIVVSVNSTQPLKPTVMLFDPTVRRERAPLLDLQDEPDLSIVKTLRPLDLPQITREYLMLGAKATYYFSTETTTAAR